MSLQITLHRPKICGTRFTVADRSETIEAVPVIGGTRLSYYSEGRAETRFPELIPSDSEKLIYALAAAIGLEAAVFLPSSELPQSEEEVDVLLAKAPESYSFGDCNRSLITASSLHERCTDVLPGTTPSDAVTAFLEHLERLGETYIDLEN